METLQANIFSIQRFSVHDGPGIRTTVFFKGCSMACVWCHNPESISPFRELLYNEEKCTKCGRCGYVYKDKLSRTDSKNNQYFHLAEEGNEKCLSQALEIAGKFYTPKEVFQQIKSDIPFYEESGGGATFSGGECMLFDDFLLAVLKMCKEEGIHTTIDTCGNVPYQNFEKILDYTDLFLYDVKIINPLLHQKYTKTDNQLILENLKKLSSAGANISLRFPLIEGVNFTDQHKEDLINLVQSIQCSSIHLLPYHDIGKSKYDKLGLSYKGKEMKAPDKNTLDEWKQRFENYVHTVKIGG